MNSFFRASFQKSTPVAISQHCLVAMFMLIIIDYLTYYLCTHTILCCLGPRTLQCFGILFACSIVLIVEMHRRGLFNL